MANQLKQEIFAVGKWNGFDFTLNDLRKMASSFNALQEVLKVPLKLGHNDEQPVLDGQPALGWVSEMAVIGSKLVATFDHVPDVMMKAFEKKLYRSVSIELDFDVHHKDNFYDFVITAVALLGADMPAVNVLNDLGALMSRNSNMPQSDYVAGQHLNYSAITGKQENQSMTPEEIAQLKADLATARADVTTAEAKFSKLETDSKTKIDALEASVKQMEDDAKKSSVEAARAKFSTMLEDAVSQKIITPAQRESFTKVLRIDDDDAVLALKEDDVKGLFGAEGDKGKFSKDTGMNQDDDDDKNDPALSLSSKAHEYMAKSGEKDFSRAIDVVMAANPAMARDYINGNGEVQ